MLSMSLSPSIPPSLPRFSPDGITAYGTEVAKRLYALAAQIGAAPLALASHLSAQPVQLPPAYFGVPSIRLVDDNRAFLATAALGFVLGVPPPLPIVPTGSSGLHQHPAILNPELRDVHAGLSPSEGKETSVSLTPSLHHSLMTNMLKSPQGVAPSRPALPACRNADNPFHVCCSFCTAVALCANRCNPFHWCTLWCQRWLPPTFQGVRQRSVPIRATAECHGAGSTSVSGNHKKGMLGTSLSNDSGFAAINTSYYGIKGQGGSRGRGRGQGGSHGRMNTGPGDVEATRRSRRAAARKSYKEDEYEWLDRLGDDEDDNNNDDGDESSKERGRARRVDDDSDYEGEKGYAVGMKYDSARWIGSRDSSYDSAGTKSGGKARLIITASKSVRP